MKNPDEIKKALECCGRQSPDCGECAYFPTSCDYNMCKDALEYIKQLEAERAEKPVKQVKVKIDKVIEDIRAQAGTKNPSLVNWYALRTASLLAAQACEELWRLNAALGKANDALREVNTELRERIAALVEGLRKTDLSCLYCGHRIEGVSGECDAADGDCEFCTAACPCKDCENNNHWEFVVIKKAGKEPEHGSAENKPQD